ncbi:MAG TPA: hypothetical protein VHN14_14415 [Kofleriaceae bacterium]|nr:hypothetical protein [Kofleriaceae bacterium]
MDDAKRTKRPQPGTERARDERRATKTPRYGGGPWQVADERGNRRFGHARNDDAHPSELAPGEAESDDHAAPNPAGPAVSATDAAGKVESSGQRAGMKRGEKPRKVKARTR